MIKKVWLLISLGLFFVVTPSYCLEYNGMSVPPETIKNLSPETIQNLPAGVLKQLPPDVVKSISKEKRTSRPADSTVPSADTVESVESAIDNSDINSLEELSLESLEKEPAEKEETDNKNEKKIRQDFTAQNVSVIEKQYRYGYSSLLTGNLQQFGYDVFRSAKAKPSSLAVPDKNYILGTGDNLLIRVWGTSVDVEYPAVVDREGVINVPKIGPIPVAGVKYGDVESVVKKEAEKYIQGININITLIELRSLEIYVVGEVKNPGLHMLPAFSTIFDGLLYAGGVKKTGTLRKIKLYRNDIEIQLFDLYDLLLKGNRKSDTTLNNKDVIFVGEIGKTAAVAGAVNNEAIFEISGTKSIKELVTLAGGVLPQAFGDRIYLRRFDKNRAFVVQDINMEKTPDAWNRIKVGNGDLLELDFMGSSLPYVVRLSGNVWKPDIFNYRAGMTISDVLTTPDLLMPDSLTTFALIFRYDRKTTRTSPMRFPLSKVFSGEYDAPLQPYDKIIILSREKIGIKENITLDGAVWKPGGYKFEPGLKLKDALALAGGVKREARTDKIEVTRQIKTDEKFETEYIKLDLKKDKNFTLQPDDAIFIPLLKDYVVRLEGHIWNPKVFKYHAGMTLSEILISKDLPRPEDLLKPGTLMDFGLIYRYDGKTTRTKAVRFPLADVFNGSYDAAVQPFDKIVVLSREKIGIKENFTLEGAVWKPGEYKFEPGLRLKDALALAGGVKREARTDKIEVTRQIKTDEKFETEYIKLDLKKDKNFTLQPDDAIFIPLLKDYVVRLEGHIWNPKVFKYHAGMTLSEILISKDLPKPEDLLKPGTLMDFGLIYRYDGKTTRTKAVRFPLADVFNGSYDAAVQPFDKIMVLSREEIGITENIHIAGAVWNGGQYNYQPGLRLKDALALAGGLKFGAGTERIEIARQTIKDSRIETDYVMLDLEKDGGFLLQPNDSIMVPRIKDASLVKKITLTGEVRYPGTYTIKENETVSDLISRAGGFTEDAYFYGAKYTSEKAREIQQNSINKMIEKLQLSYMQTSAGMTQTATSAEDAQSAEIAGAVVRGLLDKLRSIRAEGRVAIKIADIASFKGSLYDFKLQDGDTLGIPQKPAFVSVVGSVYSPGSFLYEPNKRLNFYLGKSGGAAKTADKKYIYLLKANGEIISMAQKHGFFKNFGNTVLMPGDTIVVPENLERVPYLKIVKDVSDIVFKIATTAGIAFAI